jgi:hypothetical protein
VAPVSLLGTCIKALNVDLTVCAAGAAGLFTVALVLGWDEAEGREQRFLWADIGLFAVIGLITGNISWMFYFGGADPLSSLAHPLVRLVYLIGGPAFFTLHVANVLRPRLPWWRSFLCVLGWNLALIGVLVAADQWGWP